MGAEGSRTGILGRVAAALTCVVLLAALCVAAAPASAWAYFDRGAVEVTLGATSLQIEAGKTASVTVGISPASDEQLEGCGMPTCPQGCSDECLDENGQCQCAGDSYSTYYADAVAYSSDSNVAIALYDAGTLTIYARSAGEATITLCASLRQFTDGKVTIEVTVTGEADSSASGNAAAVETPEEAEADQEDKADVVEKDVMGKTMRYVRINDACDAETELADFAGTDGDLTFWYGDTYYHPVYSLTVTGTDYDQADAVDLDPELTISSEASGALSKILEGLDGYVLVEFAFEGALPSATTVFASVDGVLEDDAEVALYSYDEQAKCFVLEDAQVQIVGGYAQFSVEEGKTYAVSTRDLATEATAVVELGASAGTTASVGGDGAANTPPIVFAAVAIVVLAAVILLGVFIALRRAKVAPKQHEKLGQEDGDGEEQAS